MNCFKIVLAGLFLASTSSFAALPDKTVTDRKVNPRLLKVMIIDRTTGQTCSLGERNIGRLDGALFGTDESLQASAKEVVTTASKQTQISECSAQIRSQAEPLLAGLQEGNKTAAGPLVVIGVYYAVCTVVDLFAAAEQIQDAQIQGDEKRDLPISNAARSVCFFPTSLNLGMLIVGGSFFSGHWK